LLDWFIELDSAGAALDIVGLDGEAAGLDMAGSPPLDIDELLPEDTILSSPAQPPIISAKKMTNSVFLGIETSNKIVLFNLTFTRRRIKALHPPFGPTHVQRLFPHATVLGRPSDMAMLPETCEIEQDPVPPGFCRLEDVPRSVFRFPYR
jgi:hypothetical protein